MSNEKTELKKGDAVVMHSCIEASGNNKGKIWICKTDQFIDKSKNNVVFLEGFSGSFVVEYLERIDLSGYYKESPTPLSAEEFIKKKRLIGPNNFLFTSDDGNQYSLSELMNQQTAQLRQQVEELKKENQRLVDECVREEAESLIEISSLKERNEKMERASDRLIKAVTKKIPNVSIPEDEELYNALHELKQSLNKE